MAIAALIFLVILQLGVILWLVYSKPFKLIGAKPIVDDHTSDVAAFYNQNTDKFLEVYGEVIQAFRTKDVSIYLDYTIENAELKDGQKILDAGCGVGGPAG